MNGRLPLRIAVAPSGFKECLEPDEVAEAIAVGLRRVLPDAVVDCIPLVDGGEGSARALAKATGGELVSVPVTGPVGQSLAAQFALLGGAAQGTALVEMAAAAGLRLVPPDLRDPGFTSTYGVGELITAALDAGVRRIVVGCGDSGTCDGGAGALQALGARVLDRVGRELPRGGSALVDAVDVDPSGLDPRLADTEFVLAVNPHNLLTGARGVARVFGPQKGATARQVEVLAAAMDTWGAVLDRRFGVDLRETAGAGASGGLGAGLAAVLGARLAPRFEVLLDHVDLDSRLAAADLVITAEGAIDFQTPRGKVPAEVARRAKRYGKPVIALAGTIGRGASSSYQAGIDAYTSILVAPVRLAEAIEAAPELIAGASERTLRLVLLGAALTAAHPDRRPIAA